MKNDSAPKEIDDFDIYAKALAADLRKLSQRNFFMAKHEIQGVLFKYQIAQLNHGQGDFRPSDDLNFPRHQISRSQGFPRFVAPFGQDQGPGS